MLLLLLILIAITSWSGMLLMRWNTSEFLYWSCVSSWFLHLLTHHDLHHLHHWINLCWNWSFFFVLENTILICTLGSISFKFAVWMDINAPFTVCAFWEKLTVFWWMNKWAFCIIAAWIKSASNFFLTYMSRSLDCFSLFLYLNLWLLSLRIITLESLSSFQSILLRTIGLFIDTCKRFRHLVVNIFLLISILNLIWVSWISIIISVSVAVFHVLLSIKFDYSFVLLRVLPSITALIVVFAISVSSLVVIWVIFLSKGVFFFVIFNNWFQVHL